MRRLTCMLAVILLLGAVAPAPASADFLSTTGDILKKGWEGTKNLVKKGVDGVKSLFSGGASEEKLPTQMKKVDETQRTLAKKQENLISYYNTSTGSSASNPFIQERVNDLKQATEANEKAYAEMADNLAKLEKKNADLSQYKEALGRLAQGQDVLAKNQASLERHTGPLVAKASGTGEGTQGEDRNKVAFGAYDSKADDPTTPQDESEQTVNGMGQGTTAAPAAPVAAAGFMANGEVNPDDPKVLALMQQWLGQNGLDTWGRVIDGNTIAADAPDLGGQSRGRWLWTNLSHTAMQAWVKSQLGSAVVAGATATPAPAPIPAPQPLPVATDTSPQENIVAESQPASLNEADAAAGKSVTEIQTMMQNGQGQSASMQAAMERYRQQKAARDAAIQKAMQERDTSNQMQATDQ